MIHIIIKCWKIVLDFLFDNDALILENDANVQKTSSYENKKCRNTNSKKAKKAKKKN